MLLLPLTAIVLVSVVYMLSQCSNSAMHQNISLTQPAYFFCPFYDCCCIKRKAYKFFFCIGNIQPDLCLSI